VDVVAVAGGALVGGGLVGVGAVAVALTSKLRRLEREIAELKRRPETTAADVLAAKAEAENEQLKREITNLGRIADSKLYRDSFEDVAFAATQAALRLSVAEEELRIARQCLELGAKKK